MPSKRSYAAMKVSSGRILPALRKNDAAKRKYACLSMTSRDMDAVELKNGRFGEWNISAIM